MEKEHKVPEISDGQKFTDDQNVFLEVTKNKLFGAVKSAFGEGYDVLSQFLESYEPIYPESTVKKISMADQASEVNFTQEDFEAIRIELKEQLQTEINKFIEEEVEREAADDIQAAKIRAKFKHMNYIASVLVEEQFKTDEEENEHKWD